MFDRKTRVGYRSVVVTLLGTESGDDSDFKFQLSFRYESAQRVLLRDAFGLSSRLDQDD